MMRQLGLFAKIGRRVSKFITIVKGVYVCNDNVAMFSPLAPIKIFRLNRPTRRDACAISAHNQVCCRSSPVYPGAPDRQNQVCYIISLENEDILHHCKTIGILAIPGTVKAMVSM